MEGEKESSFVRTPNAQRPDLTSTCLTRFSPVTGYVNQVFSSLPGRFQCSQTPFTVDSVLVSFRRSQAAHQVNSVPIIQDILKYNGVFLGHLELSLVIPLRSSIEATGDDPVTLHDRHNDSDFVTIDVTPLPT